MVQGLKNLCISSYHVVSAHFKPKYVFILKDSGVPDPECFAVLCTLSGPIISGLVSGAIYSYTVLSLVDIVYQYLLAEFGLFSNVIKVKIKNLICNSHDHL